MNKIGKVIVKEFLDWIKAIGLAIIIVYFVQKFIFINLTIPSLSMYPTLQVGDRCISTRLSYLFSEIERGDVIIFTPPFESDCLYVKRVIGLPGETIEGKDGMIYINGNLIPDYSAVIMNEDFGPFVIPEDSYFMMGDNRNNSYDSRFWDNHFVTKEAIYGRVLFKYYPEFKLL